MPIKASPERGGARGAGGEVQKSGGSVALQSAGKPADSKNPAALMYGGWVRILFGGSKWVRALPARGSNRLSALPTRD